VKNITRETRSAESGVKVLTCLNEVKFMRSTIKHWLTKIPTILVGLLQPDTWQQLEPCDVLLVRHDNNCGYTYQGKAYAQLIDSIGDLFTEKGLKVRTVATSNSRLLSKKAFFSPVSLSRSSSISSIVGKLLKLIGGEQVGTAWITSRHVEIWSNIIEKARPKCIIGIQPDEYLCHAGRFLNIPVYDLQHGIIADEHLWYGWKYRCNTSIEKLPTGFLCWNEQSVATIKKWSDNTDILVKNTGNPWFIRFIRAEPNDVLVNDAIKVTEYLDDQRPLILVSLQWGLKSLYPEPDFNGFMIKTLENIIMDTMHVYNWMLRLHPVQLRTGEREKVFNYLSTTFGDEKAIESLKISEIPLPVILHRTSLHLTYSSSIVIEAAWAGVRSGILNQQIKDGGKLDCYYSYERSIGMAEVLPHDPEIIKQWIADTLAKGHGESTMNTSGEELDAFINEIVEGCKNRNH